MAIKLMYITNNSKLAKIAEDNGVDRIFLDLEQIGKFERQGHIDSVKSLHTLDDVIKVRKSLTKAELLVRTNPIHLDSSKEIDSLISAGADVLMLPYFKTASQVRTFISLVAGRAKVCLLFETPEAVDSVDEILDIPGIDEVHIGLNDLHLGYQLDFMFELLTNGVVEHLCNKFKAKGISYGFGGIAQLYQGILPAKHVLTEHYRVDSSMVILSRSFFNPDRVALKYANEIFQNGVQEIREYEAFLQTQNESFFFENRIIMSQLINQIKDIRKIQIAG